VTIEIGAGIQLGPKTDALDKLLERLESIELAGVPLRARLQRSSMDQKRADSAQIELNDTDLCNTKKPELAPLNKDDACLLRIARVACAIPIKPIAADALPYSLQR
jgi:hypothetical protein